MGKHGITMRVHERGAGETLSCGTERVRRPWSLWRNIRNWASARAGAGTWGLLRIERTLAGTVRMTGRRCSSPTGLCVTRGGRR